MHRPRSRCSRARRDACSRDCMRVVVHGSRPYLPSAETFPLCFDGGEGKHKRLCLPSRSLPPSNWSFRRLALQQRCKIQASVFMHLEPFSVRGARVRARGGLRMHGPRGRQEIWGIRAKALQRILRSAYMMGRDWQLKAPNLDQCEPLRGDALPAWSAGDCGKCSCGGVAAGSFN